MDKIFGNTVQLYTTGRCDMNCPHCSSRLQQVSDMTLVAFKHTIKCLEDYGVNGTELFANDGLSHPEVIQHIGILNKSKLRFALLTVGKNTQRLMEAIETMNRARGGIAFSVDFTKETSEIILTSNQKMTLSPYATKANIFWQLIPSLKATGIPVRVNIVISSQNYNEVLKIAQQVVGFGFAVSFCFIQTVQPAFLELLREGFTSKKEKGFQGFLETYNLDSQEIDQIIAESHEIISHGELTDSPNSPFNKFRGWNIKESYIPIKKLDKLKQALSNLKAKYGDLILPDETFIQSLGGRGIGCRKLIKQKLFSSLKVNALEKLWFCCDLHDKHTESYSIGNFHEPKTREVFLGTTRKNPYILLCSYFNPCSFSINDVILDCKTTKGVKIDTNGQDR